MYEMIDMHSKYDNMQKNGMFYANIGINNPIILCINCMLVAWFPKGVIISSISPKACGVAWHPLGWHLNLSIGLN